MRQQLRERSVAEAWKLRQTSFFFILSFCASEFVGDVYRRCV